LCRHCSAYPRACGSTSQSPCASCGSLRGEGEGKQGEGEGISHVSTIGGGRRRREAEDRGSEAMEVQVVRWRRLFCGGLGGCESVNGLQRTSLGHRWGCRARGAPEHESSWCERPSWLTWRNQGQRRGSCFPRSAGSAAKGWGKWVLTSISVEEGPVDDGELRDVLHPVIVVLAQPVNVCGGRR
jgi:hypothetical protein